MSYYIGTIVMFSGRYEPENWAFCNGQIASVSEHPQLFSILGDRYGGNGTTTFGLPDLRGRAALHPGTGPGLTPRFLGEISGTERVYLYPEEMPEHTHNATTELHAKEEANAEEPTNSFIAGTGEVTFGSTSDVEMNANAVQAELQPSGGNLPHNNMQPYFGSNFIICINGLYPPRH